MTSDQVMALLRQIVPIVAGIAVSLGFLTANQVQRSTEIILQIAGPVLALGGALWAIKANSKASIIQSATQMPEVNSTKLAAAIEDPDLKAVARENATPQTAKE